MIPSTDYSNTGNSSGKQKYVPALTTLVIALAVIFTLNWLTGRLIAQNIDEYVTDYFSSRVLPFDLTYDAIKVNPLLGKVDFISVKLDFGDGARLATKSIRAGAPMNLLIPIIRKQPITELTSLKMEAHDCLLSTSQRPITAKIKKIVFGFRGQLSEDSGLSALDYKQRVFLTLEGLSVNLPEMLMVMNISAKHRKKVTTLDEVSINATYLPESKTIDISSFRLINPMLNIQQASTITFNTTDPEGLQDIRPVAYSVEDHSTITPGGLKVGHAGLTGRYTLQSMNTDSDYTVSFGPGERFSANGASSMQIRGVVVELRNQARDAVEGFFRNHMQIEALTMDSLDIYSRYEGTRFVIYNSGIRSPYLNIALKADMEIIFDNDKLSDVNIATFRVEGTDLTDGFAAFLREMEEESGINLPRENGTVVFEMKGSLSNPSIKGIDY